MMAANMTNRPAKLNRALLTVIGLLLLVAGAFILLTAFGVWPWLPARQRLLPTGTTLASWAPYVVVVVAILLGLACLPWLAAQTIRRPKTNTWRLADDPDTGVTTISNTTAVDPLETDIENHQGVRSAHAWLTGHPADPHLVVRVRTEHDTQLDTLRDEIHGHALPRLRQALALEQLPTTVHIEPTTAAPTHTR